MQNIFCTQQSMLCFESCNIKCNLRINVPYVILIYVHIYIYLFILCYIQLDKSLTEKLQNAVNNIVEQVNADGVNTSDTSVYTGITGIAHLYLLIGRRSNSKDLIEVRNEYYYFFIFCEQTL